MSDSLRLFNTMSGKKETFRPLTPGRVSMFVCGPTVQSLIHDALKEAGEQCPAACPGCKAGAKAL